MARTKKRPLPSQRITPRNALLFGIALSVLGFVELWLGANLLTALLGAFTLSSYLFIYTPLKQVTPHSTTIGAIPGAMPPIIGYAAAYGGLTPEAWTLFGILFLWQFPHFYSIAWLYRDDYSKAGIKMLPVVDETGIRTARQILFYALLLVPVSLLPTYLGMSGNLYLLGAFLLSLTYVYFGFRIVSERTRFAARKVLLTLYRVPAVALLPDDCRPAASVKLPFHRTLTLATLCFAVLLSVRSDAVFATELRGGSGLLSDRSKRSSLPQQGNARWENLGGELHFHELRGTMSADDFAVPEAAG